MSASVTSIRRYPVKSMQGESLDRAILGPGGIALDRGWALKDEDSGNILSAKREGALLQCSARYCGEDGTGAIPPVEITLPDGTTIRSGDPDTNACLSVFLGRKVSLWPLQPKGDLEHYRLKRDPDADIELELREIFALESGEDLPDFAKWPPEILAELMVYSSPRGTYFDMFPLNLLSEASLRRLSELLPDTTIGVERFRPNIVVGDAEGRAATIEFGWVGHTVAVGEARVEVVMECPRCVMTTREQPGYEKASGIMRTLVRELDHNLGVYATVVRAGEIAVGDRVEPV